MKAPVSRHAPLGVALAVLVALISAGPARAWTYGDTLTVIWKPLPNLPTILRPGDALTVWANAPSSATGWSAALRLGALVTPLAPAGGGWQASLGRWVLDFTIPADTPEEMYDLTLQCDVCAPDTARHSVKVIPTFRSDYYFAQISDTHLPEHAFSDGGGFSTADTSGMGDFDAVIDDLNLIHPEFIIHTGDLVNEGELEEYLGMYEMGRAQGMLSRLRDPIFVATGNHDIGGWKPTPPPDGTSRLNWWRYFGWRFLGNPPAADPHHSQDYSFDYGLLHVIGLEAYINNGSYDSYETGTWGAQSFTSEQMSWLAADVAAVPAGHSKLLFYHYDFGGTLPGGSPGANFSQINPAALNIDGAIWGHNHGVAEGNRTAKPFNLGLQAVIDGRRTFRIFRVHDGVMTPGPMHHSGGAGTTAADSLVTVFTGPNDGTRSALGATVTNRFGEAWDHAQLVFYLADHDSVYSATGGTVARTLRQGGIAAVAVDCVAPASGSVTVTVTPSGVADVGGTADLALRLDPPSPNPWRFGAGTLTVRYAIPRAGSVRLALYDLGGRRVATLVDARENAGAHARNWDGLDAAGHPLPPGIYIARLESPAGERRQKVAVVR